MMKKSHQTATETLSDGAGVQTAAKQNATKVDKPVAVKKGKIIEKAECITKAASNARSKSNAENGKLVCRYCGSDDLAPSFVKRRDARCRACFKQRYGLATGGQALRKVASV